MLRSLNEGLVKCSLLKSMFGIIKGEVSGNAL